MHKHSTLNSEDSNINKEECLKRLYCSPPSQERNHQQMLLVKPARLRVLTDFSSGPKLEHPQSHCSVEVDSILAQTLVC